MGKRWLIPVNSSMIVTQPLSDKAWEKIGWAGMECLGDAAHTFIYAQRTSDGRIAIGGRGSPYRFASGTGGEGKTSASTVHLLHQRLSTYFPEVNFGIEHAWSGILGVTRDWCASVTFDRTTGTGSAVGYAGHGVSASNLAGRTLVDRILDRDSELLRLPWVTHKTRNWEPEPIRWLGVHGMYRLFGIADRWEESRHSTQTSLLAKFGSRLADLRK
jgi:glycine/D-amino acid oxidase-like deaminating enzyme